MDAKIAAEVEQAVERIDEGLPSKQFQSIRFREGDVVSVPTCDGDVEIEMVKYKGRYKLNVPKKAGAKVRKKQ